MIDSLAIWQENLANVPAVTDPVTGSMNVANVINDRIFPSTADDGIGIETDPDDLTSISGDNPIIFVFGIAAFSAALQLLAATEDTEQAITDFAAALKTGMQASAITPNPLTAGSTYIPPTPSPTTTFSAITSITIDALSLDDAEDKILEYIDEIKFTTTISTPALKNSKVLTLSTVPASLPEKGNAMIGSEKIGFTKDGSNLNLVKALQNDYPAGETVSGENPNQDLMAEKIREAFLLLKVDVVGSDSSTPSPLPLQILGVGLL